MWGSLLCGHVHLPITAGRKTLGATVRAGHPLRPGLTSPRILTGDPGGQSRGHSLGTRWCSALRAGPASPHSLLGFCPQLPPPEVKPTLTPFPHLKHTSEARTHLCSEKMQRSGPSAPRVGTNNPSMVGGGRGACGESRSWTTSVLWLWASFLQITGKFCNSDPSCGHCFLLRVPRPTLRVVESLNWPQALHVPEPWAVLQVEGLTRGLGEPSPVYSRAWLFNVGRGRAAFGSLGSWLETSVASCTTRSTVSGPAFEQIPREVRVQGTLACRREFSPQSRNVGCHLQVRRPREADWVTPSLAVARPAGAQEGHQLVWTRPLQTHSGLTKHLGLSFLS